MSMKLATRMGVIAGLALGLTSVLPSVASAGVTVAPAVTVSPSTGIADGAEISVIASGLRANTSYHVGQCAVVDFSNFTLACNAADSLDVTTDADGNVSTAITVRRVYDGVVGAEGRPWGEIDCTDVDCGIGLADETGAGAGANITFN